MSLFIELEKHDRGMIVRIEGRLDAASTPQLERALEPLLKEGVTRLLLDFTQVEYLSSAGMRLLLSVTKRLKVKGGLLLLFSLGDEVKEIIRMAGFEKILQICGTEAEAVRQL